MALFDANNDRIISAADGAAFTGLTVWRDLNQDGRTDAHELFSLTQAGVQSISLTVEHVLSTLGNNLLSDVGTFTTTGGVTHTAGDVWFRFDAQDTRYEVTWAVDAAIAELPDIIGNGNVIGLQHAMSLDDGLRSLVEQFTTLGVADLSIASALVDDILYRWSGVDGRAEHAFDRGSFGDARHLAVYEAFRGTPFSQWGGDARPNAGSMIEENYRDFHGRVLTYLILQTQIGQALFPEVSYALNAFVVVEPSATLASTVVRLGQSRNPMKRNSHP